MNSQDLLQPTARLLEAAGLRGDFHLLPLAGGANNKVFRVEVNGRGALLKAYFQHPEDPRDRLGVEFAFSRFAWEHGVRCIPRPLAYDPVHRLGLYEFVEGRRIQSEEITEGLVLQALEFYRALNRERGGPDARALAGASEACFSIAEHLTCVERRLTALKKGEASSPLHQEALSFIQKDLSQAWERIEESVVRGAQEHGFSLGEEILAEERRLSPSDFGFHNALLAEDGRLRFIDFEYAGWDDPAKTVCDFFCLQGVRVPEVYFSLVAKRVAHDLPQPERQLKRIDLLIPIHQIKWCCILLNDFLPAGLERRRFADEDHRHAGQKPVVRHPLAEAAGQKAIQLEKARTALKGLRERDPHGVC